MDLLQIVSSVFFVIGLVFVFYALSQSESCTFIIDRVNIICDVDVNISMNAVYVVLGGFFLFMGYVFYTKSRQMNYSY